MAPSHIIRIPRTDKEGSFILGEVTQSGSKPLNVKLVATEGEAPYVLKLRHDRIGELRASSSPCSPEEWETVLKSLLLGGEPVEGIEAGAEANLEKAITITIRRRVAGISQRLGTLTLPYKEEEEIALFDWCGAALLDREQAQASVRSESAKVTDLEAQIAELRSQLDELTQSKADREAELLEKFCTLLNEKKVKIREQQRLLSTAKVDPSRLDAARAAQATTRSAAVGSPKASPSRKPKRKALEDASGGGESDSEDGFETVTRRAGDRMDLDVKEGPETRTQETPEVPETPESQDRETSTDSDATASESEDEAPVPPPPTRRQQQQSSEPRAGKTAAGTSKAGSTRKGVAIHPIRKPIRKPSTKAAAAPPADGSETQSDDEL
ncbi:hypothetical protein VTJ49DRAFT_7089 [Mycothermus thermophilus]|uniref:Mitotic apparatus protein p62 n=1 Tax=Humicola insolens TaxID=85995 RepID=A0ABR3VIK5_HUMIN